MSDQGDMKLRDLLGAAPNLTGGKDSVTYLREKRDKLEAAIEVRARVVHEAWHHEMVRQGRRVAPERAHWETLEERDRDIDRAIARQVLAAARPVPSQYECPVRLAAVDALIAITAVGSDKVEEEKLNVLGKVLAKPCPHAATLEG